jgi:hypothetical protein
MTPTRRSHPKKRNQISKSEQRDFERFGCTFRERTGVFYIDWRGKSVAQVEQAEMFARLVRAETKSGLLLLLAFQISAVRPLPHYCYFPFNLGNQVHRDFLARLTSGGEIRLCFCGDRQRVERTHGLGPHLQTRAAAMYSAALHTLEEGVTTDFEAALLETEHWMRVPEVLAHWLSEHDLVEIRNNVKEAAEQVSKDRQQSAHRVVREAWETLKPYYEKNEHALFERAQLTQRALVYISDMQRLFAGDSDGLTQFIGDAVAATLSQEEVENLGAWLDIGTSILQLFVQPTLEGVKSGTVPSPPVGLSEQLKFIAARRGISKESLFDLARLVGLPVGDKPGRTREDYSLEYGLKLSGLSWSAIARKMLAESVQLQTEFHAGDYDSLDRSDQEKLSNRIRQGVRAYASRTGKPLQSEPED